MSYNKLLKLADKFEINLLIKEAAEHYHLKNTDPEEIEELIEKLQKAKDAKEDRKMREMIDGALILLKKLIMD